MSGPRPAGSGGYALSWPGLLGWVLVLVAVASHWFWPGAPELLTLLVVFTGAVSIGRAAAYRELA